MTSSFEEVLKKYAGKICKMAAHISRGYGGDAYIDDLVAAGNVAIWQCYERFDSTRMEESNFWMFAQIRVKGAMYDELRSRDYLSRTGRQLVKDENTEEISWAPMRRVPFDKTVFQLSHDSDPHRDLLAKLQGEKFLKLISQLPPRHQQIIHMYFVEDHNQAHIAQKLRLSEGRISQIRIEAIALMKKMIINQAREYRNQSD